MSQSSEIQQPQNQTNDGLPAATTATIENDPLRQLPSGVVRDGDHVILAFADGRQMIAQALPQKTWRGKHAPFKFQKKTYPTNYLIGLPYGAVLEINPTKGLVPLPEGEDVVPRYPNIDAIGNKNGQQDQQQNNGRSEMIKATLEDENEANADDSTFPAVTGSSLGEDPNRAAVAEHDGNHNPTATHHHHPENHDFHHALNDQVNDNRHIVDNNDSQGLDSTQIEQMIREGTHGSDIVSKLVQNSSSFGQKTTFSQAKYIARKQRKYQPRCRIVRCTPLSVCEAFFQNKARQILNMREDTLGQILSYSNVSAGCQVLVYEHCMGILTGALAQRMGGYGQILSLYETQQPSYTELIQKFNLSFGEHQSIKWIHTGDVFGRDRSGVDGMIKEEATINNGSTPNNDGNESDPEKSERDSLTWPIPLQDHTRQFLEGMKTDKERKDFLEKRCARFARKLTRNTPMECNDFLFGSTSNNGTNTKRTEVDGQMTATSMAHTTKTRWSRKCDSIILAIGQYDSTTVLLNLWSFLAPSSPFVVYCEYIEPLTECFHSLQQQKLAINLRLSDTWMREYQVLPGRTHPSMNMTQSGGFILTGIKLDPVHGHNDMDEELAKEIRQQIGGRRGKKKKRGQLEDDNEKGEVKKQRTTT
jgi:tRNA (adenine-N(1)-)-methyltransferase non-catalytic subunit